MSDKRKTIWEQFVEKQDKWIGGRLQEIDRHTGDAETKIVGMKFEHNAETGQDIFSVVGEDWNMVCDIQYLGIPGEPLTGDGWIGLHGPMGMSWRIKQPEKKGESK